MKNLILSFSLALPLQTLAAECKNLAFKCQKNYFDATSRENPVEENELYMDLCKGNFAEEFIPLSPSSKWAVRVEMNQPTGGDSGRPGTEDGPLVIDGLGDDRFQIIVQHILDFSSSRVRGAKSLNSLELFHSLPVNSPFENPVAIEIKCEKIKSP